MQAAYRAAGSVLAVAGILFFGQACPGFAEHRGTPRNAVSLPVLIINEDNSHFFGTRPPEKMTLAGLHELIDQYAGTAVTHLFLCPNAMKASFRSRTRDAIWDPINGQKPQNIWPENAERLHAAGLDPYAVWIARCREKGLSPWLTIRMNDVHGANDVNNFQVSTFWRENPQLWRVPHDASGSWTNRALNYAHEEVRAYQRAFIEELLERYDPDGIELDWMRFGYHLTPGREREEGPLLTEFVRGVRELTKQWSAKRQHEIKLSVRVPTHPDAATGLGMDAVTWAKEGLVDIIVPAPFWASSDFDIPVELWRERLGNAADRVFLFPALEYNSRPWPGAQPVPNDLALARGFAASAYARGADGIYLFNWMDSETRPVSAEDYALLLLEGLSAQVVAERPRRHPVCYRDTVPAGFPNDVQLPVDAQKGGTFRIHIGPRPLAGRAWVVAGLAGSSNLNDVHLEAKLNNRPLKQDDDVLPTHQFGGGTTRALSFTCPLEALQDGYNEIQLVQTEGPQGAQIVWVEIRIDGKPASR